MKRIKWILLAAFALWFLGRCSVCDLYPGGNSHAGPKCLYCRKSFFMWTDEETGGKCEHKDTWEEDNK